jgi:hypothetical protein
MRLFVPLALGLLIAPAVWSADMTIAVEIPRLNVAEYHRPYLAFWIERPDQSIAAHLAVWYQIDPRKEDGREWLKDMRQWWRRGGRALRMPVDGVTGATRPVGEHTLRFGSADAPLSTLAPGKYNLVVEAAREVGGRELLKVPFEWPGSAPQSASAKGSTELGAVTLNISP